MLKAIVSTPTSRSFTKKEKGHAYLWVTYIESKGAPYIASGAIGGGTLFSTGLMLLRYKKIA